MTYAYGVDTGGDVYGLETAGLTEASCNLDVFCNLYSCVCAPASLDEGKRAITNWFEVLECNGGVNIFNPSYDPPSLSAFFFNETIDAADNLKANYLNDLWKKTPEENDDN